MSGKNENTNPSEIPGKEWRWGKKGVHTHDGCLTWFDETTGFNHSKQSFEDFRRVGAWAPSTVMRDYEVPEKVWVELHQLFGVPPRARRTREKIDAEVSEAVRRLSKRMRQSPLDRCPICRSIPRHSSADRDKGESLSGIREGLSVVLSFYRGGRIYFRCSHCGRLFQYSHVVDNEPFSSSDVEYLDRMSPEEIGAVLLDGALKFEWTWDDGWEDGEAG